LNRAVIFDAVKKLRGGKAFTQEDVTALDRAIDEALREAVTTIPAPRPSQGLGRRISDAMFEKMKDFEGCELQAYPDPGSHSGEPWTVGYGATGSDIKKGTVWTQAQADARFRSDIAKFEDGVSRLLGSAPTTQHQFDALVSLAYNIGLDEDADTIAEGLGDSSLLKAHLAGDYAKAASKFVAWRFNDGREMAGLKKRRLAEAAWYKGS
jgi:lysozyme